jgi:hypothetical protein
MLATLNANQIVDEIVKDAVRDNDPHDAVHIAPEIVLASRADSAAPKLAPDIAIPRGSRISPASESLAAPDIAREPRFSLPGESAATTPVDTGLRVAPGDREAQTPSAGRKWLRGALVTMLLAGGSTAAAIAWDRHGDAARQMLAEWTPTAAALIPAQSQTNQVANAPVASAAADQAAGPSDQPPSATQQVVPTAAPVEATPSVQAMTRDLAAMAQQIEQLKASLAELKAGQDQMAREMAKPPAPKPVADARSAVDAHARLAAPSRPPVRKPKPVTQAYTPSYPPTPLAPPAVQAAAVPPPPPVATSQALADDNGPVVRPPMPLR